ncbi:MAG: helix-turn-helix transcriptional regulator [Flavobacteriales bacterium]|nr:helix-turn-helix transcriptional regulator [Flavobacteriales bacterium]
MNIKSIDLFGKTLFSWVTIEELVHMPTPMPENEAAFVYTLEGSCVSYSETHELNITANQAVLAKSGNSTFKTVTYGGSNIYSAISIRFNKEVLEKVYNDTPLPFYKKSNSPLTANSVKIENNELLSQFSKGLIYYFDHQELLTDELLILKLKELIVLLLQTEDAPKVLEIMSNLFENKTFEFKEIVKAHIYSSLNITELAQLTKHNLSSFKKEFKRLYNNTPSNYIIDQRIEKVAKLLTVSNDSISNIAYDCEFKTLAHMSRVFKTKYRISPSEYRLNFSDKQ